jgi:hypothetical protein
MIVLTAEPVALPSQKLSTDAPWKEYAITDPITIFTPAAPRNVGPHSERMSPPIATHVTAQGSDIVEKLAVIGNRKPSWRKTNSATR